VLFALLHQDVDFSEDIINQCRKCQKGSNALPKMTWEQICKAYNKNVDGFRVTWKEIIDACDDELKRGVYSDSSDVITFSHGGMRVSTIYLLLTEDQFNVHSKDLPPHAFNCRLVKIENEEGVKEKYIVCLPSPGENITGYRTLEVYRDTGVKLICEVHSKSTAVKARQGQDVFDWQVAQLQNTRDDQLKQSGKEKGLVKTLPEIRTEASTLKKKQKSGQLTISPKPPSTANMVSVAQPPVDQNRIHMPLNLREVATKEEKSKKPKTTKPKTTKTVTSGKFAKGKSAARSRSNGAAVKQEGEAQPSGSAAADQTRELAQLTHNKGGRKMVDDSLDMDLTMFFFRVIEIGNKLKGARASVA